MKINIAHLFSDILNLYGENGNIKALKYALEKKGFEVNITNVTLEDNLELPQYDFIYIGSGEPHNLKLAKEKLKDYKNDFLNYIKKDKIMLVTGSALSVFDFLDLYEISEEKEFKVADVTATTSLCNGKIYAFQNTQYLIKSTTNLIFNLETGYGNNTTMLEGFKENNFYVTSLIGPLLARNDNLTQYFTNILMENTNQRNI